MMLYLLIPQTVAVEMLWIQWEIIINSATICICWQLDSRKLKLIMLNQEHAIPKLHPSDLQSIVDLKTIILKYDWALLCPDILLKNIYRF